VEQQGQDGKNGYDAGYAEERRAEAHAFVGRPTSIFGSALGR
jgi:hypothetical protein